MVSLCSPPGSLKWHCVSINPGKMNRFEQSIVSSAVVHEPIFAIFPSLTPISVIVQPSGRKTVPPLRIRS